MTTPGITVRPLVNMAGQHHFNEVFFDDVRVPATNVVGEVNRGWYVSTTTLDFERSSIGSAVGSRQSVERYLTWMRANRGRFTQGDRAAVVHQWVERWVEVGVSTLLARRVISMQATGQIPNSEASIAKLYSSELSQRIARTAVRMLGMWGTVIDAHAPLAGEVAVGYPSSVSATIAGGTSEIQRTSLPPADSAYPAPKPDFV